METKRKSTGPSRAGRIEQVAISARARGVVSLQRRGPDVKAAPAGQPQRSPMGESRRLPWDRPFFFVWSPSELAPKRRHPTAESAHAEAARLAALFPPKLFLVFEAHPVSTTTVQS